VRHPDANEAAGGRIRTVRLALGVDGLIQRFGRPVPDVVALLDRIADLRARAARPPHPTIEVELVRFGAGDVAGLAADLAALGLEPVIAALEPRTLVLASAAELASADPSTDVMLFAGREDEARAAIRARVPAYVVSDRPRRAHWHLAIVEALRVVAESVRLPVPRPISDAMRTGALVAMPERGLAEARARGTEALLSDAHADWVSIGGMQIFYTELKAATESLLSREGARLLAKRVNLSSLGLSDSRAQAAQGVPIFETGPYRLGDSDAAGALSWRQIRRGRFGGDTPSAPVAEHPLPSVSGAGRRGGEGTALDLGVIDVEGEAARCFTLPYADRSTDGLLAVHADAHGERLALALQKRLGGDAVLVCEGDGPTEVLLDRVFWEAERNRLRAVVRLAAIGDEGATASACKTTSPVRIVTARPEEMARGGPEQVADWVIQRLSDEPGSRRRSSP
jgi:hypothetical protein